MASWLVGCASRFYHSSDPMAVSSDSMEFNFLPLGIPLTYPIRSYARL